MLTVALFALAVSAGTFEIPLKGAPIDPATLQKLKAVSGISRIETAGGRLQLQVADGAEVRLSSLAAALATGAPSTAVDRDRLPVTANTIFEMNAGQCFFCAEKPIGHTLSRLPFVKHWAVVDYVTKGRMRFRVEPNGPLEFASLQGDPFEDVILTMRYAESGPVDLYWPTGGVAWRPDEKSARREATESKKPLMIFPTAGT